MRKLRTDRKRGEAGYTLTELLVVLVILTLIATIVTPRVFDYLGRAKSRTAKIQIEELTSHLDLFRLDVGRYPTASEGLQALVTRPDSASGWSGPYLRKASGLTDPWGAAYVYKVPGNHGDYDLLSFGADGREGGEGEDADVTSWE